jgi:hypothetical protein
MTQSHSSVLGLLLKGILAGVIYIIGTVLSGMLFAALHIPIVNMLPPGANQQTSFATFPLTCLLLGLAMVPLTQHTSGSRALRGLALFFLMFICLGVTTIMETKIFLTIFAHGGAFAATMQMFLPTLLCAFALSFLFPQANPAPPAAQVVRSFFSVHSPISWVARFVLAILAFAVIYFTFGAMIAPFVVPFYRAGVLSLTLPPFSVILPVLFVRSALFLLACLPFVVFWTRSRGALILALGVAFWFLTGLFGILQVFFWPPVMRMAHGLELGADSFVYATVLVFLLLPRPRRNPVSTQAHAAAVFPS